MTMYAKRMAAILAVLIMAATIAGCNTKKDKPKEKTERAMGRYVEKTIAMPKAVEKGKEHAYQMVRNAEGKPEIYSFDGKDYKDVTQYRLKEDNTWVKDNPPWLKQNSMSIDAVTCTADGTRYAIVRKRSVGGSKQKVKILKISNNENCEEIVIKDLSKETGNNTSPNIPIGIEVSKDNQILLEFSDRMSLYENGKIKYSFKKGGHDYALSDNKLLLINEKTDGVLISDLNTGKIISEIPCADSIEWNVFTADRQGNWYMVSNLGIQRLANGGNRWETILDGSMASMGEPSLTPDTVLMGKDGGFYVMYMRNGGTREIKYYVYDKDAPTIPSKTLSIVSLDENSTIRQGIAEFQKINKDVRVDYKTAETQKENGSIADFDYIMAMNTQLLAGKGADIILLDGIPIDSYIEKGVLADLSEVINPLLDQKEVLGNMIEPYKTEGKIYTAPVRFGIPIAFGRKEAVEAAASIQTLADYAKNNAKLPLLGENIYNDKELTTLLFQFYSQSFLGENGDLDQEGLIRFLECLKVIRNQTKANQGEQEEVGGNWLAAEAIFKGKSELGLISINGMFDTYVPFAAQEKIKGELTSVKQKLFIPKGLVGVNNASKNKDLAFAFVKQLYAEEVQVISLGDGFPVNRKVIEKFELEESDGEFRIDGIEVAQPSLEKMQSILNLCKTLTTPVNDDKKLLEMITRETVPYLSGKADVARTADKIMQRVKTYLSE